MKIDYAKQFTLRSDGRYMGYWHELVDGQPIGIRHAIYDKDPKRLFDRIKEKESPKAKTFADMAEAWEEAHVQKLNRGTQSTYRAPLNKLIGTIGTKNMADVTSGDLDKILQKEKLLRKSYKHAALIRSIFKQICDYAIAEGEIVVNPALSVRVPTGLKKGHIEAPSEDEEAIIKANLDKPFGNFVALLLYTGMRTEEAAALTWEDIDFKKELIRINKAMDLHGTPKLKETKTIAGERTVPIMPPLLNYLKKPKGAKGYVFNVKGKPMTRAQIKSRWLNWCKASGLAYQKTYDNRHRGSKECVRIEWRPMISPHQLRHYFATILFENNVDVLTTQRLMGHKDIETTQKIYTSLRNKYLEDQYDGLKKIFS